MRNKFKESRIEKVFGIIFFTGGVLLLAAAAVSAVFFCNTTAFGEYSSSMEGGNDIALYADDAESREVQTDMLPYLPALVLGCVGLPFFVVGGVLLLVDGKRRRDRRELMVNGRRIMAEVTGGRLNFCYNVNGRHPWKLECKYEDAYTGAVYLFSSGNTWCDPNLYIGQQVAVYVADDHHKKYYVDLESLLTAENGGAQIYDYR